MKGKSPFLKKARKQLAFFWGLLLLTVLFMPQTVSAMKQARVAIFNFVVLNMAASGYGTTVTNMLGDSLKADPSNSVVDRKDLEAFLHLNDYRQDDRVENAVKVGTGLGVNVMIVGNVEKRGSWIIMNCQTVLVEQKKVIFSTRIGAQGDAGLAVEIRKLAGSINEAIAKHVSTPSDEPLKAPVNIQKRPGNRQIYLSWEDPPNTNADGYDIYRSNAKEGLFAKIAQVHQREHLDKDLERSATYYYKIKSFTNSGLQSGFTEVIVGKTALTPNPPVILKAESRVKGVQLIWAPSPIAGDDPLKLAGYKLFRANSERGPYREAADLTGSDLGVSTENLLDTTLRMTYVDGNLADGEEVYYRITAYNEKKIESGFSSVIKGVTIPVISGLSARGGMVRQISLFWNAIDSPYLKGYGIYRSTKEEGDYTQIGKLERSLQTQAKIQYEDREGLGDNLRYYYRVTAYDDTDRQTVQSPVVSALTKPRPVTPAGLKGESLKVKEVTLIWQANPEKDIVAYHIYRREGTNGQFSAVANIRSGDTRYQDRNLKDGISYGYRIQAEDKDGVLSDFSEEISVSTKPRPNSPTGLTGTYRNGNVELAWKPGGESDIAYYKIYEKTFWRVEAVPGLDNVTSPFVIFKTTLDRGKTKTYLITVVDRDSLESDYSPEIVVTGE